MKPQITDINGSSVDYGSMISQRQLICSVDGYLLSGVHLLQGKQAIEVIRIKDDVTKYFRALMSQTFSIHDSDGNFEGIVEIQNSGQSELVDKIDEAAAAIDHNLRYIRNDPPYEGWMQFRPIRLNYSDSQKDISKLSEEMRDDLIKHKLKKGSKVFNRFIES